MPTLPAKQVSIQDDFWGPKLQLNADIAIFHQWEQLEKTGCIENFRLVADNKEGFRLGFFFADSDAFKWLDAAARVYASYPSEKLKILMDDFIALIGRTQTADGYIYTYNQFHFPEVRWTNLQIEHELYCFGHLIEAAVSHFGATGEHHLLDIAIKAADLLVREFSSAGPTGTPGHEEIELALIQLAAVTQNQAYLDLAQHFIERRGRVKPFITHILSNKSSFETRGKEVAAKLAEYQAVNPEHIEKFKLPDDNISPKPPLGTLRWFFNTATGKYFQQHKPVRQQTVPVGHSVRFTYLKTAIAMLEHANQHTTKPANYQATLETAWDHMVTRRMYVTGGIGSIPDIEGFGRDYELDPIYSYSETCAALGNIFWNWEMTQITNDAKYADLTEWQFYNVAAVGLAQDGASYLYNNPLTCEGQVTRQEWFKCPCCPSNISRVWADLGKYVFSIEDSGLWVHQYIGSEGILGDKEQGLGVRVVAGLPWDGGVKIQLEVNEPKEFAMNLRIPSWCDGYEVKVNGERVEGGGLRAQNFRNSQLETASGYDPRQSFYLHIQRIWSPGDVIEIDFELGIQIRATHPKVKATRDQVAVTRGPLVYCLESVDNPKVDIFNVQLDPSTLVKEFNQNLFGGTMLLQAQSLSGKPLTFLPYYLWANRGESQMTVYVNVES